MSLFGDIASVLKTVIMVNEEITALKESVKTSSAHVLEHEKRLIRIETMIELSRTPVAPAPASRKGLAKR